MKTFKEITGEDISPEEWTAFWKILGIVCFGATMSIIFISFIVVTIKLFCQIF